MRRWSTKVGIVENTRANSGKAAMRATPAHMGRPNLWRPSLNSLTFVSARIRAATYAVKRPTQDVARRVVISIQSRRAGSPDAGESPEAGAAFALFTVNFSLI